MSIITALDHAWVYRLWQAPFARRKLAPILAHNDLGRARRVLDVGCGPGTNAALFQHAEYLGVDINEAYIESARRRFGDRFAVADVTKLDVAPDDRFDFILVNSLLHHIATDDVRRILGHLATLLTHDGHVHILDLVLPERVSAARYLAQWDRGDFPRPLETWHELFSEAFVPVVWAPYPLGVFRWSLWDMVYFKGQAHE